MNQIISIHGRLRRCVKLSVDFFLITVVSLLPFFVSAQKNSTGSKISSADAKLVLDHHNQVRKKVGVGPLKWDAGLAAYAQRWAENLAEYKECKLVHRSSDERDGKHYGENIFWGSSEDAYAPLDASKSWFSEIDMYNYERFNFENLHQVGHYTQMVWRKTKAIGVGVAVCPSGGIIIVANYNPPGNYLGEFPY